MMTSMVNQKRGLTESIISFPAMETHVRQTTSFKLWSKRKTLVEPRLGQAQTN